MFKKHFLLLCLTCTLSTFSQEKTESDTLIAYEIIYVNKEEFDKQIFLTNVELFYVEEGKTFYLEGFNHTGEKTIIALKYAQTNKGIDYFEFFNNEYEFINDEEQAIFYFKSKSKQVKDTSDSMYRVIQIQKN
ncbi:hypothetical protein NWE55_12450 [Myroides albus]|uniref:hypothetical protein n=1 Tax=Myroides albus TaxID=2562892 RepID=UPI0021593666|nr:hypothetical protein [Myroides albus]UVD78926.1 hypothetical protein NWE55_12450 [Myroides albus]